MAKRKVKKKSNGKGVGGKADVHAHEEGKRTKAFLDITLFLLLK